MKNLSICALDLFGAGTETTTTTLDWGLLFMIYYPEIQGLYACRFCEPVIRATGIPVLEFIPTHLS